MISLFRLFSVPSQAKRNCITFFPKNISFRITSLFILTFLLILSPNTSYAENLDSDNFKIQMSTINITGGKKSNQSGTINLSDTVGQTFQGQFDSNGFRIRAGFQYINDLLPFIFLISDLHLDFGVLYPLSPSYVSNNLTIVTGTAYGYNVKVIENHALQTESTPPITIPDTACDASYPCTINDANVWTNHTVAYGLGYSMSGAGVDTSDFINLNYYRPFPNNSLNQSPVTIMSSPFATTSATSTVTYKANISGYQAAGDYQNNIQFIATPIY